MTRVKNFLVMIIGLAFFSIIHSGDAQQSTPALISNELTQLETTVNGRLGVYAINTSNNQTIQFHAKQRFPMCSTYKLMGVAAILKKSMSHPHFLQKIIHYRKFHLVDWSPITKQHVNNGMMILNLCKAAITISDNTAINLLMKQLGGLSGVNDFAHSIGDKMFRIDRWEPQLNSAIPGDLRDTTTPEAMGQSLRKIVLGSVLAPHQRQLLQTWLKNNKTGASRIRAGVPADWVVGDKTGSGQYGATNDIGIIWPKKGAPIVLVVYFVGKTANAKSRNNIIAATTRDVLRVFKG